MKRVFIFTFALFVFFSAGYINSYGSVKKKQLAESKDFNSGQGYSLIVGISNYDHDDKYPLLKTPAVDAAEIGKILKANYGFDVTVLKGNVKKKHIISALRKIHKTAGENDSVFIYFAGYGEIESLYDYGWWIPSDAKKKDISSYLDNRVVHTLIRSMKAKHVLLVSNSSFSKVYLGKQADTNLNINKKQLADLTMKKSRVCITFGENRPVVMSSSSKYSLIGEKLISILKKHKTTSVSSRKIYNKILSFSKKSGKTPVYLTLKNTGDEKGEFVFEPEASVIPVVVKIEKVKDTKAAVSFALNVKGAVILIDGKKMVLTEAGKYNLLLGRHTVSVSKKGFVPVEKDIYIKEIKTDTIKINLIPEKKKTGRLFFKKHPLTARISILEIKRKYKEGMSLDVGKYTIVSTASEYEKNKMVINIKENIDNNYTVTLKPVPAFINSLNMKFVAIDRGHFMMGSPLDEKGRKKDETLHRVNISNDFYIMDAEVTIGQWKKFIKETKYMTDAQTDEGAWIYSDFQWEKDEDSKWDEPGYTVNDFLPVTCVSYNDVKAFLNWINKKDKRNYRLPSESEWEYVCRAKTTTSFSFGNCLSDQKANYDAGILWNNCSKGEFRKTPLKVKSFKPNAFGVYDMHGNVSEWCSEIYKDYNSAAGTDNQSYVVRGGAWETYPQDCRSAGRNESMASEGYSNLGFRLVSDIKGEKHRPPHK